MSATRKPKRVGSDNYPTEQWAIRRFLESWPGLHQAGTKWLEPCAGDGVIMDTVNQFRGDIDWTAIEVRDTRKQLERYTNDVKIGSFFDTFESGYDVVIMNPPFGLLMDFVEKALKLAPTVITFQSLNFLGSTSRNEWLLENTPNMYVLPDRTSHTGDGKSDSIYSAWFVWEADAGNGYKVLPCTPLEERKADRSRVTESRNDEASVVDRMLNGIA
jgi:hypothetical protein